MQYILHYDYDTTGKDMSLINKNKKEEIISKSTAFYEKALQQIKTGKNEIVVNICSRTWNCTVSEVNNKYILNEHR